VGRYKTSFAYDRHTDEELGIAFREALERLDFLSNGDALRLRSNEQVANLNQLSKSKRAALRLATMESVARMREEMRRRGLIVFGELARPA